MYNHTIHKISNLEGLKKTILITCSLLNTLSRRKQSRKFLWNPIYWKYAEPFKIDSLMFPFFHVQGSFLYKTLKEIMEGSLPSLSLSLVLYMEIVKVMIVGNIWVTWSSFSLNYCHTFKILLIIVLSMQLKIQLHLQHYLYVVTIKKAFKVTWALKFNFQTFPRTTFNQIWQCSKQARKESLSKTSANQTTLRP